MADLGVNSRELVEQIWSEVADEQSIKLETMLRNPPEFEQLIHDEERRYINARCQLATTPADLPPAGSLKALKGRLKRRAGHFVVAVLGRYFADEHEFMAHLVRLQNKLTVDHDRMAHELRNLHHALRVESERLRKANLALHARLEERMTALERDLRSSTAVTPAERA